MGRAGPARRARTGPSPRAHQNLWHTARPTWVDHPESGPADDRRIGHVVGEPLGELLALPHAVDPVAVPAVAAADVDRARQLGPTSKRDRRTVAGGGPMVAPVGIRVPRCSGSSPAASRAARRGRPSRSGVQSLSERKPVGALRMMMTSENSRRRSARRATTCPRTAGRPGVRPARPRRSGGCPRPVLAADPDLRLDCDQPRRRSPDVHPGTHWAKRCASSVIRLPVRRMWAVPARRRTGRSR